MDQQNPTPPQQEDQHHFPPPPPPPGMSARPQVLTVFLVLTFVGFAFTMLSTLLSFGMMAMGDMGGMMSQTEQPGLPILLGGVVFAVGKFFGAMEMWKMRKRGFPIYTVSEIGAQVLAIVSIFGATMQSVVDAYEQVGIDNARSLATIVMVVAMVFSLAISGVFIGIYGTQSKKMS